MAVSCDNKLQHSGSEDSNTQDADSAGQTYTHSKKRLLIRLMSLTYAVSSSDCIATVHIYTNQIQSKYIKFQRMTALQQPPSRVPCWPSSVQVSSKVVCQTLKLCSLQAATAKRWDAAVCWCLPASLTEVTLDTTGLTDWSTEHAAADTA